MLLAVDTSTRWIGLALYNESQVLGEFIWQTHNFHTVELAPALEQLLERCKAAPKDLQALAVALGPGSFTSLRIGLAAVKGMALGLKIPIIGIPSLDIVAFSQPVKRDPPHSCSAGRPQTSGLCPLHLGARQMETAG